MRSEEGLQEQCAEYLRDYLNAHEEIGNHREIKVGEQVPIIKDCTFVPEEDSFTVYLGHTKADVALYQHIPELTDHLASNAILKLWQNGDDEVNIPYAVLEIKRGDSATTGAIRTKNVDARELKDTFSFLNYFFVADQADLEPGKIYRVNKRFDAFFVTPDEAEREWIEDNLIKHGIEPHLQRLKSVGVI